MSLRLSIHDVVFVSDTYQFDIPDVELSVSSFSHDVCMNEYMNGTKLIR